MFFCCTLEFCTANRSTPPFSVTGPGAASALALQFAPKTQWSSRSQRVRTELSVLLLVVLPYVANSVVSNRHVEDEIEQWVTFWGACEEVILWSCSGTK